MKPSISLALLSLLGIAAAQLGDLPKCAQDCATPAIPATCSLDIKCICTAKSFLDAITCCVAQKCTPAEQEATIKFADAICGTAGVTDLPQSVVCSTGSATPSSSASFSSSTATSSGKSGSSSASSAPTSSNSSKAPSTANPSPNTPANTATATSGSTSQATGGAAAMVVQNGGAAAAMAAIALALV